MGAMLTLDWCRLAVEPWPWILKLRPCGPVADAEPGTGAGCDDSAVPLALFDLDNTLIDRGGAFRRWAA
jgi:hypothetical protein